MEITRSQIQNILESEIASEAGRALLSLVLDKAFTADDFEAKVIQAWRNCPQGSSPLVHAVKMARTLRPHLGLAEAKAAVDRLNIR